MNVKILVEKTLQVPTGANQHKKVEMVESVCLAEIEHSETLEIFIKTQSNNVHRLFNEDGTWKTVPSIGYISNTIPQDTVSKKILKGESFCYKTGVGSAPILEIFIVYNDVQNYGEGGGDLPIAEVIVNYYKRNNPIGVVPTKIS